MRVRQTKENITGSIILLLYVILFASLFFSWRAITSIAIGLLLIAGIFKQKGSFVFLFENKAITFFIVSCLVFFLFQFTPLLIPEQQMHWSNVQMKSAAVLIPIAVVLTGKFNGKDWRFIWQSYCLGLAIALLICILTAFVHFTKSNDGSGFFYHSLVKPLHLHAVYFSIYVFAAFIILMEGIKRRRLFFRPVIHYLFLLFFVISLILLSSKLVLLILLISLLYYGISFLKHSSAKKKLITISIAGLVLLIGLVLITRNPVSERFREILKGDLALVRQEQFHPGVYFSGAQLRLLHWRFVPEIIRAEQAWWTGVGSSNAQKLLDEKYISTNMYTGDPSRGDTGFLGFNTHNQLLASLLKNGIPGVVVFLSIIAALMWMAWQQRKSGYLFLYILLLIYSFVESVLEAQFALFLFVFFPVFLLQENKANH